MKDATTRPSARASRSARTTTSTSAAAAARRTTRRRRGPSPRRSRPATTRRRTSPPSRRTGGSRARRRSAAATRCSFPFHDLPLPRRDCRASLRSGPVAPLPRGAVARHALRCRPPLVVWRALTLVSRNEPLFVEFLVFFVDGVLVVLEVPRNRQRERESKVVRTRTLPNASGLETLASKQAGLTRARLAASGSTVSQNL